MRCPHSAVPDGMHVWRRAASEAQANDLGGPARSVQLRRHGPEGFPPSCAETSMPKCNANLTR